MLEEKNKSYYVFYTFVFNNTLHRKIKHFYRYCLQVFSKDHVKDCFTINCKQRIEIPKKGEYVRFKYYDRKIKWPFMIYANFESIFGSEDNGKQNADESYIKSMLHVVLVIYKYMFMIKLVRFCHT